MSYGRGQAGWRVGDLKRGRGEGEAGGRIAGDEEVAYCSAGRERDAEARGVIKMQIVVGECLFFPFVCCSH